MLTFSQALTVHWERLQNNFLWIQETFVACILYQHNQYAAFDCPNKTNVMIITPETSVARAIWRIKNYCKSAEVEQRSKKTEENKHGAVIADCSAESETVYWD